MGVKVVRATADIPYYFQSQMVKGRGHQAALGGCSSHHFQGAEILWRAHYRPHSFLIQNFNVSLIHFTED